MSRRASAVASASPFTRLARTHAAMAAGDGVMAVALAGSVFFNTDPAQARSRVALFLVLTMAPFAVLAPVVGPVIDRLPGGRRLTVAIIAAGRALMSLLLIAAIDTPGLFPLALVSLVLSKSYAVSKSALVPSVVTHETELVEANAKLGLISGVCGFAAAVPAGVAQLIAPEATVALSAVVFLGAAVAALGLPRHVRTSESDAGAAEAAHQRSALRAGGIVLAVSTMAWVRATVGFLTFHLAFWLRTGGATKAWFGVMILASAVGTMVGNGVAPWLRRRLREELLLVAGVVVATGVSAVAVLVASHALAALVALSVAVAAAIGRLAFDAIVQRDAPDADRGRAFAGFETRFQLAWVVGAFVPVVVRLPGWAGFLGCALLLGWAAGWYLLGQRMLHVTGRVPRTPFGRLVDAAQARLAARGAGPVSRRTRGGPATGPGRPPRPV
jgi:MFS family permease